MVRRKKKQSQFKRWPIVLCISLLSLGLVGAIAFWPKPQLTINREQVVLRTSPDTLAESITQLTSPSQVSLLEESKGWSRVKTKDQLEGWLPNWLLSNPDLSGDQAIAAQLLIDTPVYGEKDEAGPAILTLTAGTYLLVTQEAEGWLSIPLTSKDQAIDNSSASADMGYIPTRLVNLVPEARALAHNETERLQKLRAFDPERIAQARLAIEPEVTIQFANEPLFEEESTYSQVLYRAMPGEVFAFVGDFIEHQEDDFYLVENSGGQQAYVDSDRVAVSTFSAGRLEGPIVSQLSDATIMLDPGHGGVDTGALSWDGMAEEKVATMALSLEIKQQLEAKGATVLMTRETDEYMELFERVTASNESEVDVFISLHIDGSEDAYLSGTSTYYYHEADKNLAEIVNQTLDNQALENLGTVFGNYHVLRENTRPSLLLELGYMSNDYDAEVVFTQDYQQSIAEAVTNGLEAYFKTSN